MSSTSICQPLWSSLEPQRAHCPLEFEVKQPYASRWVCSSPSSWDTQSNSLGRRHHLENVNGMQAVPTEEKATAATTATGGGEGWTSLIDSLCNPSSLNSSFDAAISKPYIPSPLPPLRRFSFNCTSCRHEKSLELCTETLGCETGATYSGSEFMDELSSSSPSPSPSSGRNHARKQAGVMVEMKMVTSKKRSSLPAEFPPPLTTLCGDGRLGMVSTREGGRLLLTPTMPSRLLKVHRADGRLRLLLIIYPKHFQEQADHHIETQEEDGTKVEEKTLGNELAEDKGELLHIDQERNKDEQDEDHEFEGTGSVYSNIVGMESNVDGGGGDDEMGIGGGGSSSSSNNNKYARPGRCKEEEGGGGHGHGHQGATSNPLMVNWEAFWVASS